MGRSLCLRAGSRREDHRSEGERNSKKRCWSSHAVLPWIGCHVDCNTPNLTGTGADRLADVLRSMFCTLEAVSAISRNTEM